MGCVNTLQINKHAALDKKATSLYGIKYFSRRTFLNGKVIHWEVLLTGLKGILNPLNYIYRP